MDISVKVTDTMSPTLRKLSKQKMDKVTNWLLGEIGVEFAKYEANGFMKGQVLGMVTGEAHDSVGFFKLKNGHMVVSPGMGKSGRMNYLGVFEKGGTISPKKGEFLSFEVDGRQVFARKVTMPKLPFVTRAYQGYERSNRAEKLVKKRLERMFGRMGL